MRKKTMQQKRDEFRRRASGIKLRVSRKWQKRVLDQIKKT